MQIVNDEDMLSRFSALMAFQHMRMVGGQAFMDVEHDLGVGFRPEKERRDCA